MLPLHLGGHANETHIDDGVLNYMIKNYKINSFLDIGCGPGGMLACAESKGLSALGIDGDFTLNHKHRVVIHDYTLGKPNLDEKFDMCWSCEFLEHVDEQYMANYMDSFQKAKYIIVTHALPGQGGHYHVNCQNHEYWIDKFKDYGFEHSEIESMNIRKASTMNLHNPGAQYLQRTGLFFINLNF